MPGPATFPCPARIVAVTTLLVDVLGDLGDNCESLSGSEADFFVLFTPQVSDLMTLREKASAEMGEQAKQLLAEPYPAPVG